MTKPIKPAELRKAVEAVLKPGGRLETKAAPVPRPGAASGRRLRVLLAEDTPVNQRVVVLTLERLGHTVVLANNGREAVQAMEGGTFDIVLMDVQMPEMDGLQATAAIRESERWRGIHTPIIALTAHASNADREGCLAAGMDAYLSKPLQLTALVAAIGELAGPSNVGGPALPDRKSEAPVPRLAASPDRVWNREEILSRLGGDVGALQEIAGLFVEDSASLLTRIEEAVAARDGDALEASAHRLKGSASVFDAEGVSDLAGQLESLGKARDFTHVEALRGRLEQEMECLVRALITSLAPSQGG